MSNSSNLWKRRPCWLVRYLKAYEKYTGKSVEWIDNAGHNSNTDQPDIVNQLIEKFINNLK